MADVVHHRGDPAQWLMAVGVTGTELTLDAASVLMWSYALVAELLLCIATAADATDGVQELTLTTALEDGYCWRST